MKVLVFGEFLYDIYGKQKIIGGAPFNYSLQLSRIVREKNAVSIITSVGNDELGQNAIKFAESENINTSLIQKSDKFETGKATVFLDEKTKVPDYIIHENVAWDNIEYNSDIENAIKSNNYDVFYCNVLAIREEKSFNTLKKIISTLKPAIRICDITLRKNYYTKEKLQMLLEYINVLKVNDEELDLIRKLFYPQIDNADIEKLALSIIKDFDVEYIFLTLGKKGANLYSKNGVLKKPANDIKVIDTVGAGDSFAAALTYALHKKYGDEKTLSFAAAVSEEMIQVSGGTGSYDVEAVIESVLGERA